MATTYSCDFENQTPDTWTFAVYQSLPDSPGLVSVSWKQTTVPTSGESGVQWTIEYLAAIAGYRQVGGKGVYKSSQKRPTDLGRQWDAVDKDGAQQLIPAGSTTAGQVLINNKSLELANLAIGMDGDIAMVKQDVYGGSAAQFNATPKYYAALFKDVVKGEVISGNVTAGPLEVVYPRGITEVKFEALLDGSNLVFRRADGRAAFSMDYETALAGSQQALALPA